MKYIPKTKREEFKNGKFCTAYEYPMNDHTINGAVIVLEGRYPEAGRAVNEKSKEMAYVIKGKGKLTVGNREIAIGEGDLILIDPGEKFFWEGAMELFMPCTPAWTPNQYRIEK